MFSLHQGHSEVVQVLVNVCNLEAVDDHRISPLFVAAQYGRAACLQILISAGKYCSFLCVKQKDQLGFQSSP